MRETNRGWVGLQAVPVGDPGEDPVRDPEGGLLRRHVAPHLSFVQNHFFKNCESHARFCLNQCYRSMTFWGGSGSGSADPCLWLMDPDPNPGSESCYFRHWPSRCQQKTNFLTQFFLLITFWRYILHHFSKIKSQKESQNSRNQGFSGAGAIPLTSGSGSGRPKNMWIRWIRIRNTGLNTNYAHTWPMIESRITCRK